jgi:cupin 2 domain-containing protein
MTLPRKFLRLSFRIKIERITSNGHTSPKTGWHDQKQNEWVMVLKGDAIITFENKKTMKLK